MLSNSLDTFFPDAMPTSNIKKSDVPDPSSAKAKNIIISKLPEAMKQLEDYSSANDFSGKKSITSLLYLLMDECVDKAQLHN